MEYKQKLFLNELSELLEKYCISSVYVNCGIKFKSNGGILNFKEYSNGEFKDVSSYEESYKPFSE